MGSQTTKRKTENKHACASNCTLTSTSLSLHKIWINWPVSYKLMSETLRFPQSKRSGCCCTRSRDFSSLRSLPQSVEREYQRSAPVSRYILHIPQIPAPVAYSVHTSHQPLDSLHELFPRIRPNQIRTALNGRLNERLPRQKMFRHHSFGNSSRQGI